MAAHRPASLDDRGAIARADRPRRLLLGATIAVTGVLGLGAGAAASAGTPFIAPFHKTTTLASTVPANGDQNPYGIVTVPASAGDLRRGDILVSNFNDRGPTDANGSPTTGGSQGEGTTIVQFPPFTDPASSGKARVFARISPRRFGPVGLTTALATLPGGFVVVGSLPTTDGSAATASAGGLFILDREGHVVRTITGAPINGPWDMTAKSFGPFTELFVTNVLNGTVAGHGTVVNGGTVVRIWLLTAPGFTPFVLSERVIATGFPERTDSAALVVGPTGVGLGAGDILYVADSLDNRVAQIPDASTRRSAVQMGAATLTENGAISDPLGLTIAPNGDVLTTNGNDGNIVETAPDGTQVAHSPISNGNGTTNGGGDLFGLTTAADQQGVLYVDDFDNTLRLFH